MFPTHKKNYLPDLHHWFHNIIKIEDKSSKNVLDFRVNSVFNIFTKSGDGGPFFFFLILLFVVTTKGS